jgi:hypothetical protein
MQGGVKMIRFIKHKDQLYSALFILLLLIVLPFTLFAWTTYLKHKNFGIYTSGEIIIETRVGEQLIGNLLIDNLTYIDLTYDFVNDTSKTLDVIATSFMITVIVDEDSIPVKQEIAVDLNDHNDLLYLIIYEGLNVENFTTNYKDYIDGLNINYDEELSTIENEEQVRTIVSYHNQNVIEEIANTVVEPGESIAFQIVFWGDYNQFEEDPDLFQIIYDDVILIINTVQKEKPYESS